MCSICGGRSCLGSLLITFEVSITLARPGSDLSFQFFKGYLYGFCFSDGSHGVWLQQLLLLPIVSIAIRKFVVLTPTASALGWLWTSSGSFRTGVSKACECSGLHPDLVTSVRKRSKQDLALSLSSKPSLDALNNRDHFILKSTLFIGVMH